ncbi:hypothetical protein [Niabella ginsenosidivorans]|nr:hypothetical protein [Niabella ginsenosidivorans]
MHIKHGSTTICDWPEKKCVCDRKIIWIAVPYNTQGKNMIKKGDHKMTA